MANPLSDMREAAAKICEEYPLTFDYYGATRDTLCWVAKAIRSLPLPETHGRGAHFDHRY